MRRLLLAPVLALTQMGGAFADEIEAPGPTPADSDRGLSEVVVTARKREEPLQQTPVAVTAISGGALTERSVLTFRDLAMQTPSFRITQFNNSAVSSTVSLRGLVYTDIRLNADPAVGVYVDGVYIPRTAGVDASNLFDIGRVEVLKGPQGTLFGRNTTGGAVNIVTNDPSNEFGGLVRLRGGSYQSYGVSAVLNTPITDGLAARFVVDHSDTGGYGTNFFNGDKYGKRQSTSGRIALKWEANDTTSLTLRGDVTSADANSLAWHTVRINPGSLANREIAAETGLAQPAALALYNSYQTGDPQNSTADLTSGDHFTAEGISLTYLMDVLGAHLKVVSAYRDFDRKTITDFDASPFHILAYDPYETKDQQISHELQLTGDAFNRSLNWITGAYYGDESGWEGGNQYSVSALSGGTPSITYGRLESKTWGIFLQANYHITDKWSVTAGGRYTDDSRDLISGNRTATSCTALGVTIASLAGAPCLRNLPNFETHAVSYTFSTDYRITDDIFGYLKTSKGYRDGGQALTGGSAVSPAAATASYQPFQPEYVKDYEIGLKSEWLEHRLRANIDYYHSDYTDIQRSASILVPGTNTNVAVIQNVAAAKIQGVELELTARPLPPLTLSSTLSVIHPVYTNYTVGGVDLRNTPFQMVSNLTYSFSAAYTVPLPVGDFRTQLDYQHDNAFVTSGFLGRRPAVEMLNGRVGMHFEKSGLDVDAFGRNLLNQVYPAYETDVSATLGFVAAIAAPPREWGIEVSKKF
jgi:iron complex outermembrane receptor protein